MSSVTSRDENATSGPTSQQTVKSPKNAHKPLKKHMTYNLSETTMGGAYHGNENSGGGGGGGCGGGGLGGGGEAQHHHFLLNRTNSLLVAEELLNEINHANLVHNHNMSYNDNMNISNIDSADQQQQQHHRFINEHAANFVNTHMRGHLGDDGGGNGGGGNAGGAQGHLHRTREVENLVDLSDESCDEIDDASRNNASGNGGGSGPRRDDLIKTGLEMIHGVTHLTRTHEIENLNEASKDD